jgi:hypothetical protein
MSFTQIRTFFQQVIKDFVLYISKLIGDYIMTDNAKF